MAVNVTIVQVFPVRQTQVRYATASWGILQNVRSVASYGDYNGKWQGLT